ncbi:MAG: hypothetical protein ACOYM2_13325 [Rectinemataceae bacterium]
MRHSSRKFGLLALATILLVGIATAQASSDPVLLKAKEETLVVFDLGRMFGYLDDMVKDGKTPALSSDQLRKIYDIMVEVRSIERIEPAKAKVLLSQIEDRILTPAQLMATDKLAAAGTLTRAANQGSGPGAKGGTSPLVSFVAGGDFNPIMDTSKTMGKDFQSFYAFVSKKLGK